MEINPSPIPRRFQSVLTRLKPWRYGVSALAGLTALILFLGLIGPFGDELSQRFAEVVSDSGMLDAPFGLWTLSYIGNLFLGFFSALVMSFVSVAANVLFLPMVAAIGIAWVASR